MSTNRVNLDALIKREDFEIEAQQRGQAVDQADKIKIVELERSSFIFKLLRKPDFQRTTSHWSPEKIAGFITSFLTGDLIPSVILWQSETSHRLFVIDGAHRLSALIAWVHDDYGDGALSHPFFENRIPRDQQRIADETRTLISSIGPYAQLKDFSNLTGERARYASIIAAGGVTVQWVRGDAKRAEKSFHTINTEQTPIGHLELRLIRDRRCPNTISTRSLISAGTGEIGRSTFSEENSARIKLLSSEIYSDLFIPESSAPIKTLDLPVAGRSYSSDSVQMILNLVEFLNPRPHEGVKPRGVKQDILAPTMGIDVDGTETVRFLENVRSASSLISGNRASSLGLHPAVYFYSATGAYQPTAFLATIDFVLHLKREGKLNEFTAVRDGFEELLLSCKTFMNFIVQHYGSGSRSLNALRKFIDYVYEGACRGDTRDALEPVIFGDDRLRFIREKIEQVRARSEFSKEKKAAVFLRDALQAAVRCQICGARLHVNSISIDHDVRREDGGRGEVGNGRLVHPYCNSGFKESGHARRFVSSK